ncbi:MAG: phage holin family protein [Planctomycetaceae bacterium]|nr:phage holin family protein [Planctomycetaceae bacterium]
MSTDSEETSKSSTTSLVTGILTDLQQLVEQQFQLTRAEIEDELRQRTAAVSLLALGLVVLFLDAFVLCEAAAHLLHWLTSASGSDPARLALWECHSLVALVLFVIGGVLTSVGRSRFLSIKTSQEPTPGIAQETVPWTKPLK